MNELKFDLSYVLTYDDQNNTPSVNLTYDDQNNTPSMNGHEINNGKVTINII